jgi:FtsH-binding integral membrane protein
MILNNNQGGGSFNPALWDNAGELSRAFSSCMVNVFLRMFLALLVTAFAAFSVIRFEFLLNFVFGSKFVFWGLIIAEIALVFAISAGINKMSVAAANALFLLYAVINGLTLSAIFFAYSFGDIYRAFGITALMFLVMACFGALTRRDLTSIGSICIMGLFGIILASIINIFLKSSMFDYIISYVGILVFVGLTAYDTQRIKRMLIEAEETNQREAIKKISVLGALTLYLDFINLFLKILRLFRKR